MENQNEKILLGIFFGVWIVILSIISLKRGWVWKYDGINRTVEKVFKNEDPFYLWCQVMVAVSGLS
ncbi:MAG TPA: hypothetical protein DHU78_02645 [Opitutae bacterium]|nr:hypothetical protein [Opitutae bacterium]HCY57738.1 hypothetical protein [Opitutae bacterium]|tara:strand:+ start:3296 stop:3493 length:198 start_codon:yes stop_codon:yes gene_type:complete